MKKSEKKIDLGAYSRLLLFKIQQWLQFTLFCPIKNSCIIKQHQLNQYCPTKCPISNRGDRTFECETGFYSEIIFIEYLKIILQQKILSRHKWGNTSKSCFPVVSKIPNYWKVVGSFHISGILGRSVLSLRV